jgi:hypothetical protein
VLLNNWLRSEGARMEVTVAASLNQEIYRFPANPVKPIVKMDKKTVYRLLSAGTYPSTQD